MNKLGLTLVDTNVLLRYIIDDNEEMALIAEQVIEGGAWTTPEVLAEVSFVLNRVYGVSRDKIAASLYVIANHVVLEPQEVCLAAIKVYENSSLDFVDCMIVAYRECGESKVFSFDKGINKYGRESSR